ncbi:MAG: aldo/keto reductase [Capsulimonadales bacterium]|nr:aldo/keto reductase [Capsulimonadales bacterium]
MEYRPLGKTGLSVSILGLGASPFGNVFGNVEQADADRCIRAALDGGINYLDVAPFYGLTRAETVLGKALKGVRRDRYLLSTKVGRYGPLDFDFSGERVTASVEESLQRLGVSYIDIILCHDIEFGSADQIVGETLPALRTIVDSGKARFVGFSGLPLTLFPRILDRADHRLVQVILSYCHYTLQDSSLEGYLAYLTSRGVGIINASPLGMGLLQARRPIADWHPAPPEVRDACRAAAAFCTEHGVELSDLALAFSTARPQIATTLVGAGSAEEIERNIAAVETTPDPALLARVRQILEPVRDRSWGSGRPENDPLYGGSVPG